MIFRLYVELAGIKYVLGTVRANFQRYHHYGKVGVCKLERKLGTSAYARAAFNYSVTRP